MVLSVPRPNLTSLQARCRSRRPANRRGSDKNTARRRGAPLVEAARARRARDEPAPTPHTPHTRGIDEPSLSRRPVRRTERGSGPPARAHGRREAGAVLPASFTPPPRLPPPPLLPPGYLHFWDHAPLCRGPRPRADPTAPERRRVCQPERWDAGIRVGRIAADGPLYTRCTRWPVGCMESTLPQHPAGREIVAAAVVGFGAGPARDTPSLSRTAAHVTVQKASPPRPGR